MRVAILGGTFDPIHRGHIAIARQVRRRLRYDRIIFVPSYQPPRRSPPPQAPPPARLAMVELALPRSPNYVIDTWEFDQRRVCRSIEVVDYIRHNMQLSEKPGLIIGDDLLEEIGGWQESSRLLSQVRLIVARRNYRGTTGERTRLRARVRALSRDSDWVVIDKRPLMMSSSQIREIIGRGAHPTRLLPKKVWKYILQSGIYNQP